MTPEQKAKAVLQPLIDSGLLTADEVLLIADPAIRTEPVGDLLVAAALRRIAAAIEELARSGIGIKR